VQALPLVLELLRARLLLGVGQAGSASRNWICFSTLPPSTMSVPRPAMLVAMVIIFGPAGLRDDLGLLGVLLGVEHLVRQLGLLSSSEISSEFSIEVVPTSTGWPRSWQSRMSATTASYFSLAVL
jgi:hypothetical protein